ncbi:UvrD-helicase domain-containing protein [Prochlorococcus marinus]|uniref:UvrD-helicase domain-containing protein n=1 Tax=Prochlorococcus marinus TaxID=1219 RepID=UPI0022B55067|nr:UvrD-helicase domain-containing protein [Prochlorococcus marinus]
MNKKELQFIFDPNNYPLEPGIRLIEASAGTGKTFSLAHIVLRLLTEKEYSINDMLVISFTKATASELKNKICTRLISALNGLESIHKQVDGFLTDQVLSKWLENNVTDEKIIFDWSSRLLEALESIDYADITTIHSFCSKSLRQEAIKTGSHIQPQLLSEEENTNLIIEIIHEYWREYILKLPLMDLKGLQAAGLSIDTLINTLIKIDNDPSINFDVSEEAIDFSLPLHNQFNKWLEHYWDDFTNQWEKDGFTLEEELIKQARIWKGMGVDNIKPFSQKPRKKRALELTSWINTFSASGLETNMRVLPNYYNIRSNNLLKDYFHPIKIYEIEKANHINTSSLLLPKLQTCIANLWDRPAEMTWIHALKWAKLELQKRKTEKGFVSYGDQLRSLDPGTNISEKVSSKPLLEKLRQKYKVILVDEFQDTDPIQWRIINQAFNHSDSHYLLMVGDPKQSIYKFRGGDLSTYLKARKDVDRIDSLLTNFRASSDLIQGLNTLMSPGLKYSCLAVPSLSSSSTNSNQSSIAKTTPIKIINVDKSYARTNIENTHLPTKSQVEEYIPDVVVNSIFEVLQTYNNEICLNDICILVHRHEQAEKIRAKLSLANFASRLLNQGDVFHTQAAKYLQIFLDCLAMPTQTNSIRLLTCSPLMQWNIQKLKDAENNDDINQLSLKCIEWSQELKNIGLLGCLSELLGSKNIASLSKRGRLFSDLQQCAELVQEAIHTQKLEAKSASRWLRQQRSQPISPTPESRKSNSDLEENAINIITIHRSKGLEYKIVLCPYLWQSPPIPKGPLWRLKKNNSWFFSLTPGWGEGKHILENAINESIEESERLAYVAMTRAKEELIVIWSMAKGQEKNPLTYLLFGLTSDNYNIKELNNETMQKWVSNKNKFLIINNLNQAIKPQIWKPFKETNIRLETGPTPKRSLDKSWGRYSYSSWVSTKKNGQNYYPNLQIIETGKDIEQEQPITTKIFTDKLESNSLNNHYQKSPLQDFPRGPIAGDCLHKILERLDFTALATDHKNTLLIEEELNKSGIDMQMLSNVQIALNRIINIPLGGELGKLKLNELNDNQRIHELRFDLSMSIDGNPVQSKDISHAFNIDPSARFGESYAKSLGDLNIFSKGFLTGSIDLIFIDSKNINEAKWWVVDWKSNWIGESSNDNSGNNCNPSNYLGKSMEEQMHLHHYPLQAHLYLVALHRYLLWRLDNYNPKKHLGGYIYFFLRGVPDPNEIDNKTLETITPGVLVEKAPINRVIKLDDLLTSGNKK